VYNNKLEEQISYVLYILGSKLLIRVSEATHATHASHAAHATSTGTSTLSLRELNNHGIGGEHE
jgi:hypothetical protein